MSNQIKAIVSKAAPEVLAALAVMAIVSALVWLRPLVVVGFWGTSPELEEIRSRSKQFSEALRNAQLSIGTRKGELSQAEWRQVVEQIAIFMDPNVKAPENSPARQSLSDMVSSMGGPKSTQGAIDTITRLRGLSGEAPELENGSLRHTTLPSILTNVQSGLTEDMRSWTIRALAVPCLALGCGVAVVRKK